MILDHSVIPRVITLQIQVNTTYIESVLGVRIRSENYVKIVFSFRHTIYISCLDEMCSPKGLANIQ